MKFDVYRVPFSCYPRVQHAVNHLKQLSDRFIHLSNESSLMKRFPQAHDIPCNTSEFFLCIQKTCIRTNLVIEDVLIRNEKSVELGTKTIDEVKDIILDEVKTYFVFVLNENINEDVIPHNDRVKSLLITDEVKQECATTESCNGDHDLNKSMKTQISEMMEAEIYEAFEMKMKCEHLFEVLKRKTMSDSGQEGKQCLSSTRPKYGSESNVDINPNSKSARKMSLQKEHLGFKLDEKVEGILKDVLESNVELNPNGKSERNKGLPKRHTPVYLNEQVKKISKGPNRQRSKSAGHSFTDEPVTAKRSKTEHEQCLTEETEALSSFTKKPHTLTSMTEDNMQDVFENDATEVQIERMERLYDEIVGMFCRSCVPNEKRPQTEKITDKILSDALKQELGQLSVHIRGCGYRCRSLHVFVDDEVDGSKLKPDIERILQKHNCISPVVISSFCMKPFTSCNVGSKITAEFGDRLSQSGTLGGFGNAVTAEGNKRIGVTSRHVVTDKNGNPALTLKVSENNATAELLVDKSFKERRENVLDIAAASFETCTIPLNTNYKRSDENQATGTVTKYTREEMKGLDVHICGSATPIGLGTITTPKIESMQDNMDSYIIVEDRINIHEEKKPFCAEGDSGAIVCADDQDNADNVHLISMIMGENVKKPGSYWTLDLKDGIQQTEEEIKSKIELL